MHQCLSSTEVQRVIFSEVYRQDRGLGALARLGRTCHAFSSTALNVLWARLDSFAYLIQCLPQDLWRGMDSQVVFTRHMSLKDWEVFFRYSSRVQELSGPVGPQSLAPQGFNDDVIFALSTPPRYGPLIPNLRTLHWDRPDRKHAPLLHLLLTPSLVSLSLSSYAFCSPEGSIPTSIGAVCPSLKHLHITADQPGASTCLGLHRKMILSEAVPHLHSLESFICPVLDKTAITHLSHLSSLIELSLDFLPGSQLEKIKPIVAAPAFASLRSLTLRTHRLLDLTSLLEPMRLRPKSVTFVVGSVCTPDALHLFFLTLISACSSEQLSQISLTTSVKRQRGNTDQQVSLSAFQSLLRLPNIDTFEFDGPYDIVLDDDAIMTLAEHWPKLTSISINRRSGWGITSHVTPKGLIKFLSCCTALTNFALAVNLSEIDVKHLKLRPGNGITNAKCHTANFVTSTIKYPLSVATFLSDTCPKLETVMSAWNNKLVTSMSDSEVDSYRENWDQVGKLLPTFSGSAWNFRMNPEEGRGGEP